MIALQQPTRQRGFYVPIEEAQLYLHYGYHLLDDCPGFNEVMIAEPNSEPNQDPRPQTPR